MALQIHTKKPQNFGAIVVASTATIAIIIIVVVDIIDIDIPKRRRLALSSR